MVMKAEKEAVNEIDLEGGDHQEGDDNAEYGGEEFEQKGSNSDDTGEGGEENGGEQEVYEFGGNKYHSAEEAYLAAKDLEADYTKKSQELAELKRSQDEKEGKQQEEKKEEFDPDDEKVADDLFKIIKSKYGLVTKQEVEEKQEMEKIHQNFAKLEETYNGKDGMPKFKADDMIAYMRENQYPPHLAEVAFRNRFHKELLATEVAKINGKKGGYSTDFDKAKPRMVKRESKMETKQDVEDYILQELKKLGASETD